MKDGSFSLNAPRISAEVLMWAGGLALTLCLWYLLLNGQMDLLSALAIAGTLLLVSVYSPATGAILTLGYLTIMGDVRRIVAASFGQPKFDLLLLVAPAVALILAFPMLLRLRFKDRLSKAIFVLLVLMVIQIFNPQQGGITVGATGALFYIVPVLWFWIGRQYASPAVVSRLLYGCIFPLAVAAAVLGLFQTFVGFLPYQQTWIDLVAKTYTSLNVGGTVRAFGFSVSGAEYATLLLFSATGTAAAYFGSKRVWALAFPLLVLTVVLASSRGLVIKLIVTLAIVWTVRQGRQLNSGTLIRLGVFSVIGLVGVFGLASRFSPSSSRSSEKGSAAQNALEHQAAGLAHPLDSRSSTAGTHAQMILTGLAQGFVYPIGRGLGATTPASRKFGPSIGTGTGSSEVDISDMFVCLGFIGGFLYIYIIFESIRYAFVFHQKVPKTIGLPTIAILASTLGGWLIAGQYSTSSMLFFLIGALVYKDNKTLLEQPHAAHSSAPDLATPAVLTT